MEINEVITRLKKGMRVRVRVRGIRTEQGGEMELESEWRVYSDRARRRNGIGVRMEGVFGQSKAEKRNWSPNGGCIRTEQGGEKELESE
jgi:hypothetical protein